MESLEEIRDSLRERFKNPIFYSFAISWLVINYKIIVVLLSDEKFGIKFEYIEKYLRPNDESSYDLNKLLYFPFISAAIYVFLLPLLSLLSTWAHGTYEHWHSNIRAYVLRKSRLTKEQRDALEIEVANLINKLRMEAAHTKKSQADAEALLRSFTEEIFSISKEAVFFKLQHEAINWASDSVKPLHDRTIKGSTEQVEFVKNFGIPKHWAKVFEIIDSSRSASTKKIATELELDNTETLNILIRLSALNMLKPNWLEHELHFELIESSWVAFLHGRTM